MASAKKNEKKAAKKAEKDAQKSAQKGAKLWSVFSLVSTLAAAAAAKKAVNGSWKVATGKTPPDNPTHPDLTGREAFAWAAVSGALVGTAKVLAGRKAASYYYKSTGHLPPTMQPDQSDDEKKTED